MKDSELLAMPQPSKPARRPLQWRRCDHGYRLTLALVLLGVSLLTSACRRGSRPPLDTGSEPASATAPGETVASTGEALVAASSLELELDRFQPLVQQQLRERHAWQRRVLASGQLTREQQADAFGELGRLYHAYALHEAALEQYRRAAELAPEDPQWPYLQGQVLRAQNRLDDSRGLLAQAQALAPEEVAVLVRLGEVLNDLDRPAEAEPHLRRALELAPETAAAAAALAQSLLARDQEAERAVTLLRQALAQQPAANRLRTPLGLALRNLGRTDEARSELEAAGAGEVVLNDPWMARVMALSEGWQEGLAEGRRNLEEGDVERALASIAGAVAADPLFSVPRVELGSTLIAAGRLDDGREQLERALFLDPDSVRAHLNLGVASEQAGRLDAAAEHYRTGLARDPTNGEGQFRLGWVELRRGDGRAAIAALEHALVHTPEHRLARVALASAHLLEGDCHGARASLDRGLELAPRDALSAHALARVLAACPEAAVRDGRRALALAESLYRSSPSAQHEEAIALALAELGQPQEAQRRQRAALETARTAKRVDLLEHLEGTLRSIEREGVVREPWPPSMLEIFAGA